MEVGSILAPGVVNTTLFNQLQLGERLLVEVVQKISEGEGVIRVKGQNVSALLETSTQVGEKFWVKVANLSGDSLLLIREPLMNQQGDIQVVPQQNKQLIERGLPINQEIISLLNTFPTAKQGILGFLFSNSGTNPGANLGNVPELNLGTNPGIISDELMVSLRNAIPEWSWLSEENGKEKIVESLRKLGLNYEQRIQNLLKLDSSGKEAEISSLKDTVKFVLLKATQNQEGKEEGGLVGPLTQLLDKITGQQLWLKTGALDNAFMLLHLPLLNEGQPVPVQIAIESARKGGKMDEQHCRVGIQMETPHLGQVGIDAFFSVDSLTFRVLTVDTQDLPQLLEEVLPETRRQFAKLGFNLIKIETGDLAQNIEFQNFLKGTRRSGVDIKR